MRAPRIRTTALRLGLLAVLAAAACVSIDDMLASARRTNEAALGGETWPEDAEWLVVAGGTVAGAPDLEAALSVRPEALHRFVFRPGEQGDRRLTMAYHPGRGVVAGRAAAAALGVTFRRDARGGTVVVRDVRRVEADEDATITLRVAAIDGGAVFAVPVVIDPSFDGPLLVSPSVAETLHLRRFEIPGTVDVTVALGRPFFGSRARLHASIPELGVAADIEAVVPR